MVTCRILMDKNKIPSDKHTVQNYIYRYHAPVDCYCLFVVTSFSMQLNDEQSAQYQVPSQLTTVREWQTVNTYIYDICTNLDGDGREEEPSKNQLKSSCHNWYGLGIFPDIVRESREISFSTTSLTDVTPHHRPTPFHRHLDLNMCCICKYSQSVILWQRFAARALDTVQIVSHITAY